MVFEAGVDDGAGCAVAETGMIRSSRFRSESPCETKETDGCKDEADDGLDRCQRKSLNHASWCVSKRARERSVGTQLTQALAASSRILLEASRVDFGWEIRTTVDSFGD